MDELVLNMILGAKIEMKIHTRGRRMRDRRGLAGRHFGEQGVHLGVRIAYQCSSR